ncbi:YihY/virulence factor BrkB family protein [Gryllotalpicola protaetiae]|uniref:YihY/virulence factor BrkB family protein n=1 Tax=Gryllotalpicola protaetiae TaxID=2419771 RepID=A0A387BLY8_9MICO|nr:YihY/virulence factor BrkB family protein [Gryllotalpicola protaetiae]
MGESDVHESAPRPDDPRKPQTPPRVHKRTWKYIGRRTLAEFSADQCQDAAAALTYYGVLSAFPALLAIFSLLGVVGQGDSAAKAVLNIIGQVAPGSTVDLVRGPIHQFASSSAAGLGLVVGIVLAVWSASGYVGAFSRAMNRIYEIDEGRPFWVLKPSQVLLTLALIVLVAIMAVLLVISGPLIRAIGDAVGIGSAAVAVWSIARWPVMVLALIVAVALLYWGTPNVKQPRFRWISLGGVIAIVVLAIATLGFGFYVANFANYNKSYGSLGGVIIFLVWLWIANLVLLFGAEFDAEVERGRELQAGMDAAEEIQLPPRGTRQSEKSLEKAEKLIAEARDTYRR